MLNNPRQQQKQSELLVITAFQTGLELAQLGRRRENENYLDYGVRAQTMIEKLDNLLVRAREIKRAGGLS